MAIVNGYCSQADVRTQLGDDGSRVPAELLDRAVNAASRAIDQHCERRFWLDSGVATRTYEVSDPTKVYVDDIASRTGLVVKIGTDGVSFPTTLTIDSDFVLEPRNADKYASTEFGAYAFWQLRAVGSRRFYVGCLPTLQVTARHGWSAVPDDVAEACVLKAVALFKRKDAPFGVAGFGEFGAVRITRADVDVIELLSGYKIPAA